jgi:hypothetical protein
LDTVGLRPTSAAPRDKTEISSKEEDKTPKS